MQVYLKLYTRSSLDILSLACCLSVAKWSRMGCFLRLDTQMLSASLHCELLILLFLTVSHSAFPWIVWNLLFCEPKHFLK